MPNFNTTVSTFSSRQGHDGDQILFRHRSTSLCLSFGAFKTMARSQTSFRRVHYRREVSGKSYAEEQIAHADVSENVTIAHDEGPFFDHHQLTTQASPKPPFQPSYVYDEREAALELQHERRQARVRACVCCGLAVFAGVIVFVGFGLVLFGSPRPRAQAVSLLHRITRSAMIEFTVAPKSRVVLERYGRRREETTDFYGFTFAHGQLFPHVAVDQKAQGFSFNGWIHVKTNSSSSYDVVLSDHRGYRISSSRPLTQGRSRCATFKDIPPLHYLSAAADRAFEAQDWASFRMNCSRADQAPVEIVFAHIPFVFCPEDVESKSFSPLNQPNGSVYESQSQTVSIHGERMLIELMLIKNKEEAIHARYERGKLENLDMEETVLESLLEQCPYLEAPFASFRPRSSPVLDELLPNVSARRFPDDSESTPPSSNSPVS